MTYTQLAYYYDLFMKHAPYDEWVLFTEKVFQKYKKDVDTITDLGCGTGEIAIRLSKLNYSLIGIDSSSHMLTMADQKSFAQGENILWMKQDLRHLTGLHQQDVMISYCDVINYLKDIIDLKCVFNKIYNSLAADGLFIFDVHDFDYAHHHMMNQTFADVYDDFTYVWFCHADREEGSMIHDMTFFVKNETGHFIKFTEVHEQQTYPIEVYIQLLHEAGFRHIDIYNDFQIESPAQKEHIKRRFFVALK